MWRAHTVDVDRAARGRQRARDRLPRAGAAAGRAPATARPLADPRGQRRQPPLVPDDGVRPLAGLRPRPGAGRSLASGPARPPAPRRHRARRLPGLDGADGVVAVSAPCAAPSAPAATVVVGGDGAAAQPATRHAGGRAADAADVARWWPHTHGEPSAARARRSEVDGETRGDAPDRLPRAAVPAGHPERDGLELSVNDVPIFVRGAVWTPADLISMAPTRGRAARRCSSGSATRA